MHIVAGTKHLATKGAFPRPKLYLLLNTFPAADMTTRFEGGVFPVGVADIALHKTLYIL